MCGLADPASPVTQVSTTIGFKGVKSVHIILFIVICYVSVLIAEKALQHVVQTPGRSLQGGPTPSGR